MMGISDTVHCALDRKFLISVDCEHDGIFDEVNCRHDGNIRYCAL